MAWTEAFSLHVNRDRGAWLGSCCGSNTKITASRDEPMSCKNLTFSWLFRFSFKYRLHLQGETAETTWFGDESINTRTTCFTEGAKNRLLFFLAAAAQRLTSAGLTVTVETDDTLHRPWEGCLSLGYSMANSVIIGLPHSSRPSSSSFSIPVTAVIFHLGIYIQHWYPCMIRSSYSTGTFIFYIIYNVGHTPKQSNLMNKLDIRETAQSCSEVTCFALPF